MSECDTEAVVELRGVCRECMSIVVVRHAELD
jgi:hypothetical protein